MTDQLPGRPFTSAEARALGYAHRDIERLIAAARLRRACHGVYVPAHLPDTFEQRMSCLRLAITEHQVVVDRTAARIHGVDTLTWTDHDAVPIEVCALRGRSACDHEEVDGRTRDLTPSDIITVHGMRVTTPLRTALDLGCILRRREAFAALCGFARVHGIGVAGLTAELPRFKGRRGVIQLRDLIPTVDPRFESAREAWTFLAIRDAGLPLPEPQVWIEIDEVPTYRLDLAYRRRRVYVEYDGADAHERTAEQREHDAERREWLRKDGWTGIVVRAGDFTGEALDRWLDRLREALGPTYSNRRW